MPNRRTYGYCAKCLEPKEPSLGYVCDDHLHTPGHYLGCAVCGKKWLEGESRDYVCDDHLAHRQEGRR